MATEEEDLIYLQNFWSPRVGQSVREGDDIHLLVKGPLDEDGVQFLLDNGKVGFVQDFQWEPKLPEILSLFIRLGVSVNDDDLRWKNHFLPKPTSVLDAIQMLRAVRKLSLEAGEDIIRHLITPEQ